MRNAIRTTLKSRWSQEKIRHLQQQIIDIRSQITLTLLATMRFVVPGPFRLINGLRLKLSDVLHWLLDGGINGTGSSGILSESVFGVIFVVWPTFMSSRPCYHYHQALKGS